MPIIAGQVLQVTAVMTNGPAAQVMNVYDFECLTSPGGTDQQVMEFIGDKLESAYSNLIGLQHNGFTYVEIRGINKNTHQPFPTIAWPTLTTGNGGGQMTPHGVAVLIVFRTLLAGVQGRKYLGGFNEAFWESGYVLAQTVPALIDFALAIRSATVVDPDGGAWQYIIQRGNLAKMVTVASVIRLVAAYQRRRKPEVGD